MTPPTKKRGTPKKVRIFDGGQPALTVTMVHIADLTTDPKNARRHDRRNLDAIKASLSKFGQRQPVVVQAQGMIVRAGNARVEAARELGWAEMAAVIVDESDAMATAYAIADNRTAELAEWDDEALAAALADLKNNGELDHLVAGFTDEEIEGLVSKSCGGEEMEEDIPPDPPNVAVTKRGDLWTLGDHRLLCGDSADADDVARLIGGERAVLMNTDPPYGVDYSATKNGIPYSGFSNHTERWGDITGDNLHAANLQTFLETVFRNASAHAITGNAAWYLWHAHLTQGFFAAAAAAADVLLHRQIIWVKPHLVLTRSGMYHWKHELCIYGWIRGKPCVWFGEKNQTSVWLIGESQHGRLHPTQKPLELFAIPMRNHTRKGEICYEPFSGSGSQIIAAEKLERRCYALEISPRYCDVAVARWENLTGKKAVLEKALTHGTTRT